MVTGIIEQSTATYTVLSAAKMKSIRTNHFCLSSNRCWNERIDRLMDLHTKI